MTALPDIIARLEALTGPDAALDADVEAWRVHGSVVCFNDEPMTHLGSDVYRPPRVTAICDEALWLAAKLYPGGPLALIANTQVCSASWLPVSAAVAGMWPRGTATAPTLPLAVCLAVLRRKLSETP